MGVYTEFRIDMELDKNTPLEIIDFLENQSRKKGIITNKQKKDCEKIREATVIEVIE